MPAQMTKYLSSWDNLNRFVLGNGNGKAIWSTIKTEDSLYEFPLRMGRDTHGCVCKEKNLVNIGSLGKCSDRMIQFYPAFLAAGYLQGTCWHSFFICSMVRCLQDAGCTRGSPSAPTNLGLPRGPSSLLAILALLLWANPAVLCLITNMFPLGRFGYEILGFH